MVWGDYLGKVLKAKSYQLSAVSYQKGFNRRGREEGAEGTEVLSFEFRAASRKSMVNCLGRLFEERAKGQRRKAVE